MKLAVVVPFLSNGGAERVMFNLALYFKQHDIEVHIIAASDDAPNRALLPADISFYTLNNRSPLSGPSFFLNTKRLIPILKKIEPDLVLTTSDYLNAAVLMVRKFTNLKYKVVVRLEVHIGNYLQDLQFKSRLLLKQIHKFIVRNADAIVGVSRGVTENFCELYNIPASSSKALTIYNPIFENSIIDDAAVVPSDPLFNKTAINIITVGRLIRQKDQVTLLKAFSKFKIGYPAATLFMIGEGPEEKQLKDLAKNLEIDKSVIFLGYKKNPYSFVSKCDLFVLSSIYEGFGNVLVESLAVGTNVVSTDCPSGPAEILGNGEYGFLCSPENDTELADTMSKALQNPFQKEKLVNRAKEFSIEGSGADFIKLFAKLLLIKD